MFPQIDQKITELVTEQQKIDAKQAHDRSELEQLKQDILNANKQKESIYKALQKKVSCMLNFTFVPQHGVLFFVLSLFYFFSFYFYIYIFYFILFF